MLKTVRHMGKLPGCARATALVNYTTRPLKTCSFGGDYFFNREGTPTLK